MECVLSSRLTSTPVEEALVCECVDRSYLLAQTRRNENCRLPRDARRGKETRRRPRSRRRAAVAPWPGSEETSNKGVRGAGLAGHCRNTCEPAGESAAVSPRAAHSPGRPAPEREPAGPVRRGQGITHPEARPPPPPTRSRSEHQQEEPTESHMMSDSVRRRQTLETAIEMIMVVAEVELQEDFPDE